MAPTLRAALAMGLVAFSALEFPRWIVIGLGLIVMAAVAVDAWAARVPPEVSRNIDEVLSRGIAALLDIVVEGPAHRVRIRQPGTPDIRVEPSTSDAGLRGTVIPTRRGSHALPAVAARVTGPLGLASWTRPVTDEHDVLVYPDMVAARRIAAQVRHGVFRTDGVRIRGSLGLGTAFEAIREYVDGDDVRQVNWLATSRAGRPMVNQYRIEQDRDVICVVDCGRLMGAPIGDLTRLDAAVDATAAIAAVADVVGDRVGVIAFDSVVLRDVKPMRRGGEPVAQAIFDLEPSATESDYRAAFNALAGAKRSFVLVLSDLLDASAARPLVNAIPVLARRHSVAVATVSDPAMTAALRTTPNSVESAARAVVAAEVLDARSAAVLALERHRATVIDVARHHLNAACVSAYLDAKARVRF